MAPPLPIHPHRERILSELARAGALILSAPTGSGKSTQVPQYLLGAVEGKVLVLEPRRLSARSLAARVSAELKTPLGREVGYQVRFDSRAGADTKVVFQTYGVFAARLASDPGLKGVGAVVLDEFHERSAEADLSLAWLKSLRGRGAGPKVVVMSATLDAGELSRYLPGAAAVSVPGRTFPVSVRHRPLDARGKEAEGILGALQDLSREGLDGSVLAFLPGAREIRRALEVLGPWSRSAGYELRSLHGSMEPAEQQAVLEPGERPRVILATNVAETGLTVPGVTAVVDAGLHRVAAFDAGRGVNTLRVQRISRANAEQRAGRAGRTAPGRCVRLWSAAEESAMAPALKPEIARLELSSLRLRAACLPVSVEWPTPPPAEAWERAGRELAALGALDEKGGVTERGRALLAWPLSPRAASVLEDARGLGAGALARACAMAAAFETAGEGRAPGSKDLAELAGDLAAGARVDLPRDAVELYRRLRAQAGEATGGGDAGALALAWLRAFPERLGAKDGEGGYYRLADGRGVLLAGVKSPPDLLLALEVVERSGGGAARRAETSLYLPLTREALERAFPAECAWKRVSEFDARAGRVLSEERLVFRGLTLARRDAAPAPSDRRGAAGLWAEKYASGELRHPGRDEKVDQFLVRLALARRLYPDMGWPAMDADDWRLVYEEVCAGKNSAKDIERVELLPHLQAYLGPALASFLDRALPVAKKLPSGRTGRYLYHESNPVELSARLGDFVGMSGTAALCEGRLPVVFDILAPNYRTVQKTKDLSSFWKNAYPTVKKELQRRYPRHPWP